MIQRSIAFRVIVAAAGIAFVALVAAAIAIYRDPSVALPAAPEAIGIPGILFIIISSIVVGRKARIYTIDFAASQSKPERFKAAVKSLGGLPLSSLILFMLCIGVYIVVLSLLGNAMGLRQTGRAPFFLFLISTGMLDAAFIFILADGMVSRFLMQQRLVRYPVDLREGRQQRKNFIIPTFMSLMTFLFAISVALFVIDALEKGNGSIPVLTLIAAVGASFAFFAISVLLNSMWTANTGLIYRSVIDQLEHLSAAEKDLRGRISIISVDELGSISGMVNSFCSSLSGSVAELKSAQATLNSLGEELRKTADDSAGAVAQISSNVGWVREDSISIGQRRRIVERGRADR